MTIFQNLSYLVRTFVPKLVSGTLNQSKQNLNIFPSILKLNFGQMYSLISNLIFTFVFTFSIKNVWR